MLDKSLFYIDFANIFLQAIEYCFLVSLFELPSPNLKEVNEDMKILCKNLPVRPSRLSCNKPWRMSRNICKKNGKFMFITYFNFFVWAVEIIYAGRFSRYLPSFWFAGKLTQKLFVHNCCGVIMPAKFSNQQQCIFHSHSPFYSRILLDCGLLDSSWTWFFARIDHQKNTFCECDELHM